MLYKHIQFSIITLLWTLQCFKILYNTAQYHLWTTSTFTVTFSKYYYLILLASFHPWACPIRVPDIMPLDYFSYGTWRICMVYQQNHTQEKNSCSKSCCPLTAYGEIMKLSEKQNLFLRHVELCTQDGGGHFEQW